MEHERYMREEDRRELEAINASISDAKIRRARLMNKLRQRAYRDRQARNG